MSQVFRKVVDPRGAHVPLTPAQAPVESTGLERTPDERDLGAFDGAQLLLLT
jgi:hypothetical protein